MESNVEGTTSLDQDMALLNTDPVKDVSLPTVDDNDVEEVIDPEVVEDEQKKDQDEEEEEEETDEKDEKDEPITERPTINQLKTAFPEIFKKFPGLRGVVARESEFSKVFPTPQVAQEASDNSAALETFRESAISGDVAPIMDAIKAEGGLDKFSQNFLPSLFKISPDLHWNAISRPLENIVRAFHNEGLRHANESVQNAAKHFAQFLFNDPEVATGKATAAPPEEKKDEKLETDRRKFEAERYTAFNGDINSDLASGMSKLILARTADNKLKIDPDGVMSKFTKDALASRIMTEVDKAIAADPIHMGNVNRLWADAKKSGYTSGHKSRIIDAYLARAKSLIPSIRARLVSEALGSSKRIAEKQQKVAENGRREPQGGKVPGSNNGPVNPKAIDWRRTSDEDLLNGRATMKK